MIRLDLAQIRDVLRFLPRPQWRATARYFVEVDEKVNAVFAVLAEPDAYLAIRCAVDPEEADVEAEEMGTEERRELEELTDIGDVAVVAQAGAVALRVLTRRCMVCGATVEEFGVEYSDGEEEWGASHTQNNFVFTVRLHVFPEVRRIPNTPAQQHALLHQENSVVERNWSEMVICGGTETFGGCQNAVLRLPPTAPGP